MRSVFARRGIRPEALLLFASRFLLAAILSGARVGEGYAPFALGLIAASDGPELWAAALGTALGAALFLDFSHALRTVAAAILIFAANGAFRDAPWYRRPSARPLAAAGLILSVEFVYLLRAGGQEAAHCLIALLLAALTARSAPLALASPEQRRAHPAAMLPLLLGALMAAAGAQFESGFAPGRILAALLVLLLAFERESAEALAAALGVGLAMDLAARDAAFLHTASYGLCALLTVALHRGSRVRAALCFCLGTLVFCLPLPAARGLVLLYEGLAATLLFLLLPARVFARAKPRESPAEGDEALRRKLSESAEAMRELYDSVSCAAPEAAESPSVLFDRAADRVCRGCTLRDLCWERDYERTRGALNDATAALLQNGTASAADFPSYFSDRCVRFASFLAAVDSELSAYLLRRQYRRSLSAAQERSAEQYARMSELLTAAADAAVPGGAAPLLPYQLGIAMRAKKGERVSGDASAHFETDTGELCLILSDGMGCGESARRESALAVRLLERFLRAGIAPAAALGTLNGALALRAEATGGFTTVDLLRLSLRTGEAAFYKYGAAPSYCKHGGRVRRVTCRSLPAGLQDASPETARLLLEPDSFLVMVTDGVSDGTDDEWLLNLLAGWDGRNPQSLVAAILAECMERRGEADDALVLVLYLPEADLPLPREI